MSQFTLSLLDNDLFDRLQTQTERMRDTLDIYRKGSVILHYCMDRWEGKMLATRFYYRPTKLGFYSYNGTFLSCRPTLLPVPWGDNNLRGFALMGFEPARLMNQHKAKSVSTPLLFETVWRNTYYSVLQYENSAVTLQLVSDPEHVLKECWQIPTSKNTKMILLK